jgi:3-methyladenine DNA glycosylase AlkC
MTAARITAAVAVADQYAQTDGAHHKMWVIDQMLRRLLQDDYDAWVAAHPDWDAGIAP